MKLSYTLNIECGSEFQFEFLEKFLDGVFGDFPKLIQAYHKKNKVTVTKN